MKKKSFYHTLQGSFDLLNQNKYFGGWNTIENNPGSIVMSFPVEAHYSHFATVVLQQEDDTLKADVYSDDNIHEAAFRQAVQNVSADVDATRWNTIGTKDEVIGGLQAKHNFLRPNLFNSTYEAAAGFVIGNRITIKQKQAIVKKLSETIGGKFELDGHCFYSFPTPDTIIKINKNPLLNDIKLTRLKFVAEAALNGLLNREYLLSLPVDEALKKLRSINGVGAFYAQGILFRGAGIVNALTEDDLTPYAIQQAYELKELPGKTMVEKISASWDPYKMWALVLLHIWMRQEGIMPKRNFK